MKNLFIDTNIWLSLYHFTDNDLSQFAKLKSYMMRLLEIEKTSSRVLLVILLLKHLSILRLQKDMMSMKSFVKK